MLAPHAEEIREAKIVLASSSPRRVEILNQILRLDARVVASTFPEDLDKSAYTPSEYVMANARAKALEVHQRLLASEGSSPSLVIGADTVISHAGKILESPKAMSALGLGDAETIAKQTLQTLSGQSHTICTGVALIYAAEGSGEPYVETFVEQTEVEFCSLSSEVIDAYVATGEPIDKAGAYGIQAQGGTFVTSIKGDYHSAVGFPMHRFAATLDCSRLKRWVERSS